MPSNPEFMPRFGKKILLASSNAGKLREFRRLFPEYELVPQQSEGIEGAVEDGNSFLENALLKARHACRQSGLPALADDSGLCVDALDGAPGIRSARFAGKNASDERNNEKLLSLLQGVPPEKRTAQYQCALVFLPAPDAEPLIAQARWEGAIANAARGGGGFGYDPLFWLEDGKCTAAELAPGEKQQRSHRALAAARLRELLS